MAMMKPKTVAAAVAPLIKILKNLELVSQAARAAVIANNEAMARLRDANERADYESTQADLIIESLGNIVGIKPKE